MSTNGRRSMAPSSSTRNAAPPPVASSRHSISRGVSEQLTSHPLQRNVARTVSKSSGPWLSNSISNSSLASTNLVRTASAATNFNSTVGVKADEDTIRVFVRIRPLLGQAAADDDSETILQPELKSTELYDGPDGGIPTQVTLFS